MSNTLRLSAPLKKMSSCVRPGVREIRARFLRPVSALIRLDLPTLERPAKAISMPRIGGNDAGVPAAATNCQSPAKRRRPASISARVKSPVPIGTAYSRRLLSGLGLVPDEQRLEVVEQFNFGAVLAHDHALLQHRKRVIPCPVDHESSRK